MQKQHNENKIQLSDFIIEKLNIEKLDEGQSLDNKAVEFGLSISSSKDYKKFFSISFKLTLLIKNKSINAHKLLKVESSSFFLTSNGVDESFINSDFAKINAPAIAYPFLRSYISQFLLLSGRRKNQFLLHQID